MSFANVRIVLVRPREPGNVGSAALFELSSTNPEHARKEAMEALRAHFRPEFLNRIDDIVLFNPLGREQLEKIVEVC